MLNISGDTPLPSSEIFRKRIFSEWKIVFLSVVLMMTFMTFIGNIFVITSVRLERRLQTPTIYLTLSLAVTDLLVSVLVMPLSLINVVSHSIVLIPFVCHVWIILDVSLCTVSIFHLLVIAVDRYRSLTNINYRCRRSTRKIVAMVGICWSVGLVIAIPLVVGVVTPASQLSRREKRHESKRERRAARTLGIITGTFIIRWLPFFIVALISPLINSKVNVPESVQNFVLWLGYLNCLLNPIIYTVFNPEFRKAFRKLLFCRYCKTRRIN
ncbi:5-hydroxytryptamine receptor-like [Pecten maximus]|uniref:5-hydroxytryptamine receptor-like n=1 Tax=Pecten maximus TaxID=6579 RepID=UPI0014580F42|nr:5-hydroxytryptamine receptor-like [Pecten maximus]